KHEPAPCKLGKKRRELGAGLPQQASTKDHGREIGLDHEMAADPLHHDCALDRTAAEPARLLGRADAEPAELGKAPPDVAAEAELACDEPAALVEGVFLLEKARDALRQQSLLLAQRKIHRVSLNSSNTTRCVVVAQLGSILILRDASHVRRSSG